jgi:hypothetical protein
VEVLERYWPWGSNGRLNKYKLSRSSNSTGHPIFGSSCTLVPPTLRSPLARPPGEDGGRKRERERLQSLSSMHYTLVGSIHFVCFPVQWVISSMHMHCEKGPVFCIR